MDRSQIAHLTRIAKYLKIALGKIDLNKENVVSRATKNQTHTGFTTIVTAMGRESKANTFSAADTVTQCSIMQWFDYAVLFVLPAAESKSTIENVLLELNEYMAQRSYLVGQSLTLADVVVFYALSDIMKIVAPTVKEKYLNVSRWFEHLQRIDDIQQNLPTVNLSTIYLHGWATGTHI